jgi:hypothetical protein
MMQRRSEEYWRRVIEKQARSGIGAARYCREHELQRGTFLRWRQRLEANKLSECALVEVRDQSVRSASEDDTGLEVRIGADVLITVPAGTDLEFVGTLIAAIRGAS